MHYLKILRSKTMAQNTKYTTLLHIPINYFSNISTPLHRWGKSEAQKGIFEKDLSKQGSQGYNYSQNSRELTPLGYNGFEICVKCYI